MNKRSLRKILFLSLVCVCAGGSAMAAEQSEAQANQFILDEYVVTDSRVQTKLVDTPANISVVTQAQLEKGNFTNVKEVLRDVPGVQLAQGGNSGSNMGKDEIFINGDNRVLVLIDGRRMNLGGDGRYSANWMPPVEAIERIEVVKGASSAMYGSDAVGGVINIILKSGGDQKTTLKAGYGSFGTQDYTLATGGKKDGFGYYVTGNIQKRGDFSYKNSKTGNVERMEHSGYDSNSLFLKMDKEIGKNGKITLNIEHMSIDSEIPAYLDWFNVKYYDKTQRLSNNIALRYDWGIDTEKSGFVQVHQNYQRAHLNSEMESMKSDFAERTFGITAQQSFQTHVKNKITVGINWQRTNAQNDAKYNDVDGIVENKAIYIEDRWQLDDSWQINSGLRYDHYNKSGGKPTIHIAVNKKLNDDSHAYISWGQVFRAPSAEDLYWNEVFAGGGYTKGNPNLKPEHGQVLTVGYDTKITKKTDAGISAFYSDLKDAMYWDDINENGIYKSEKKNAYREKRHGMSAYVSHKFDDAWSVYASYSYVKAERNENDGLGYVRDKNTKPNIYKLSVRYDQNKWTIEGILRGVSGQSNEKYSKNSYFTIDMNAQYKITKNLKAYLNIYNLNNVAYEESPASFNRYPMPSRTIIGGVQVTF